MLVEELTSSAWKKIPRYEFVGNISKEMRKKYLHKSVDHYWKAKAQNPIRYTYQKTPTIS